MWHHDLEEMKGELSCAPWVAAMLQTLIGVDRKHQVDMYSIVMKRRRDLFCAPRVAAMLQALIGVDMKYQVGMYSIVRTRRRRKGWEISRAQIQSKPPSRPPSKSKAV